MVINDITGCYEGEVNSELQAHGYGIFKFLHANLGELVNKATYRNGFIDGFGN